MESICAAVSSAAVVARLVIAERGRASSYLEDFRGRSQAGGARESRMVPLVTLDMLAKTSPPSSFVKIDVEGAECAVLEGGLRIYEGCRPVIAIEVDSETREPVSSRLRFFGYDLFNQATGAPCLRENDLSSDILAIPK